MVFGNIEATFEFDPCTNYLVTPGFLYRMWSGSNMKIDPWSHTNIIKSSNSRYLFNWVNLASVWPICHATNHVLQTKNKFRRARGLHWMWLVNVREDGYLSSLWYHLKFQNKTYKQNFIIKLFETCYDVKNKILCDYVVWMTIFLSWEKSSIFERLASLALRT